MKYFFFIILLTTHIASSQTPASFSKNLCDFKTDGAGKSNGLKLELSIPCSWARQDGDRPHVVKKFSYTFGSSSLASTLSIKSLPIKLSQSDIEEMLSDTELRNIGNSLGTVISTRRIKIDGVDGGEIILKFSREHPIGTINFYSIYYYLYYQDKMIVLNYATGSVDEIKAKELFDEYKIFYKTLAGKTIFLNKWD